MKEIVPMQVTPSEEQEFQQATHFHTCREELGANLVQEHCLLTGKVRGGGGGASSRAI